MSKKAKSYHLELTLKEFNVLDMVLDNYLTDCCIHTKAVSAVERIVKKIVREATRHLGEE